MLKEDNNNNPEKPSLVKPTCLDAGPQAHPSFRVRTETKDEPGDEAGYREVLSSLCSGTVMHYLWVDHT